MKNLLSVMATLTATPVGIKILLDIFNSIPLLTAVLNELYYQDGTDPEIFGKIRLLDQTETSTIFVDQIIGQKNYVAQMA
jgi:hypothetical protein